MDENILTPEVTAIAARAKTEIEKLTSDARIVAAEIKTPEHYSGASAILKALKEYADRVWAEVDPICKDLKRRHSAAVAVRDAHKERLDEAWDILSAAMVKFKDQERAQIAAEQKRRREAAEKQEEEQKLAAAEMLAAQGAHDLADSILSSESHVGVPAIPETKVKDVIHREGRWKARVTNKMALVLAVKVHPELLNALDINTGWLNRQAQDHKGDLKYPGVFTEKEPDTVVVR